MWLYVRARISYSMCVVGVVGEKVCGVCVCGVSRRCVCRVVVCVWCVPTSGPVDTRANHWSFKWVKEMLSQHLKVAVKIRVHFHNPDYHRGVRKPFSGGLKGYFGGRFLKLGSHQFGDVERLIYDTGRTGDTQELGGENKAVVVPEKKTGDKGE